MSEIVQSDDFKKAATDFEQVVKDHSPSDEEKLEGYALFKQGSFGDNTKPQPGLLTGPAEKAKWNAYEKKKGTAPTEAQAQYVEFVNKLKAKFAS